MEIRVTIPVQESEKVMDEREGDKKYWATRKKDTTVTIVETISSQDTEKMANVLFSIADGTPSRFVQDLLPEDVKEKYDQLYSHSPDISVQITLSRRQEYVEAMYLAASQYARNRTKQSMSRTGTSIEQILIIWYKEGVDSQRDDEPDCKVTDFEEIAKNALFNYCIGKQTPGDDISETTVPVANKMTNTKDEMMKENN